MKAGWLILGMLSVVSLSSRAEDAPEVPAELGTSGFVDGDVKIHYVEKGTGPLVIMIHGFPDYWYSWRYQMPALAETFHVVAIDQRGYNKSGQPAGVDNYTIEKLVDDIRRVVDHHKADKAVIVGHDWGGLVAWSFAMQHPDRISRLIICDLPHPRGLTRELANNPDQQRNSQYARTFQAMAPEKVKPESFALFLKFKVPDERKRYLAAFKASSGEGMINYYKANYPREPYTEATQEFPKVTCPVLMFHGLKDTALLPGALAGTWDWIDNELTLVTFPEAGHWVHWDHADQVTRKMVDWLRP